jgi:hypothetical protein
MLDASYTRTQSTSEQEKMQMKGNNTIREEKAGGRELNEHENEDN